MGNFYLEFRFYYPLNFVDQQSRNASRMKLGIGPCKVDNPGNLQVPKKGPLAIGRYIDNSRNMKRVTDFFPAVSAKKRVLSHPHPTAAVSSEPLTPPESQETSKSPETTNKDNVKENNAKALEDWKLQWIESLTPEQRDLLDLEINTMHDTWLKALHTELTKPYFLNLKKFLQTKRQNKVKVFPPEKDVYSWSRLTPLNRVKVLILGQDPYHNDGQAHGLAFSVLPPTRPPPSLLNIYKELKSCYPNFDIPKHGSLVKWASQGVLMLNACLTVDAHQANSHAQKGWEQFTEQVVKVALANNPHVVIMAWGSPAYKRVEKVAPGRQHLVLRSVHPSPLSASRGWFGSAHFTKANEWLAKQNETQIDWHILKPKN